MLDATCNKNVKCENTLGNRAKSIIGNCHKWKIEREREVSRMLHDSKFSLKLCEVMANCSDFHVSTHIMCTLYNIGFVIYDRPFIARYFYNSKVGR